MLNETERKKLNELIPAALFWYREKARELPWRKDPTPYHILLSEIIFQQTRIEAGTAYYLRFLAEAPAVEDLAAMPEEHLLKLWQGLGYYSRARNLHKTAKRIAEDLGGVFPDTPAELRKLPGIGSYTAGAISSIAFGKPVPAVDGNVLRVLSRVFGRAEDIALPETKKRFETELGEFYAGFFPEHSGVAERLSNSKEKTGDRGTPRANGSAENPPEEKNGKKQSQERLPMEAAGFGTGIAETERNRRNDYAGTENLPGDFNQSLMDIGAGICLPNGEPKCGECPFSGFCTVKLENRTGELPVKGAAKARRIEERTVFVLKCPAFGTHEAVVRDLSASEREMQGKGEGTADLLVPEANARRVLQKNGTVEFILTETASPVEAEKKQKTSGEPGPENTEKKQETSGTVPVYKYYLRKRPEKGLLAGLWEFPGEPGFLTKEEAEKRVTEEYMPCAEKIRLTELAPAKHVFSHIEWHMKGYLCEFVTTCMVSDPSVHEHASMAPCTRDHDDSIAVWRTKAEIERDYSVPSAFRAFLKVLK